MRLTIMSFMKEKIPPAWTKGQVALLQQYEEPKR